MKRLPPYYGRALAAYAALGVVLWPVPLFNILHAESSAVVAFASFFVAGLWSLSAFGRGDSFRRVVGWQELALLVPWALLTVSALWAPNCGYLQGLLLFFLFPGITVVFAVAFAYALSTTRLRRKRLWLVLAGIGIAVLGPIYDLGFHPQFYTYNHVFGGVLGPIYDEELAIRPGLFVFRGLTLLWALLLLQIGHRLRRNRPGGAERGRIGIAGTVVAIGLCYLFAGRLGINTPAWYIRQALGAAYHTAHFDIYYDPSSMTAHEIRYVALDHEYQYTRLAGMLDEDVHGRIQSYLYPDAEMKARLTGARHTSVAPVWLPVPQVHVLLTVYRYVFPHELAHVFSREFGLPVLHATLSVGLVEGFAVALEPPDGLPSPNEQVIVAVLERAGPLGKPEVAARLAGRLSPLEFWTGRGAVSYTTMGSFVRYLLERYGPGPLKQVYARGDFQEVYGKPVGVLAREWQAYLMDLPVVTVATEPIVNYRFAIPSLFEVVCPHYVPDYVRDYRAGLHALARGDTVRAFQNFEASLRKEPKFQAGLAAWAQIELMRSRPREVIRRFAQAEMPDTLWTASVVLGDAYAMEGHAALARRQYERGLALLPAQSG
ncbi:MAG TPA: hypothetical protein VFG50_14380, partial [Rhodothermales bacterium]|nr:hypothetical protein [Rhodothermales bacterium]